MRALLALLATFCCSLLAAGCASVAEPPPLVPFEPVRPADDDERFVVSLVLSYYRRDPVRAKARLLHLLGEALGPEDAAARGAVATPPKKK